MAFLRCNIIVFINPSTLVAEPYNIHDLIFIHHVFVCYHCTSWQTFDCAEISGPCLFAKRNEFSGGPLCRFGGPSRCCCAHTCSLTVLFILLNNERNWKKSLNSFQNQKMNKGEGV